MPLKDTNVVKRTTIYDLAKITGASATAVSSVLNGSWKKRRISDKLADRIKQAAQVHGYSINLQASVLRSERSNIIGMIVPKYDNRYFGAIAEQFEAMAREIGLFPVITCTQRDPDMEVEAACALLSYQVDFLISTGATDPDKISMLCRAAGVKTLNIDLPGTLAPSIISDNYTAAKELTEHILDVCRKEQGRQDPLVFIGGRSDDHNTNRRIQGFLAAHEERGIDVSPDRVLTCGYAAERAYAALSDQTGSPPLGLFVNSTISLEGVVRWISGLDDNVSRHIRYGAFDWDPFAALLPQSVGMIKQDVTSMLKLAFQFITQSHQVNDISLVPCIKVFN